MGILKYQPWWQRQHIATKLPTSDEERLLQDASEGSSGFEAGHNEKTSSTARSRWVNYRTILTILNMLLLATTLMIATGFPARILDGNYALRATSSHSTVFDSRIMEQHTVHFNGTLFPGESPAWSRQEPGNAEAEAIWENFETMHTFPITRSDVLALGKDPETAAKYSEDFGLGNEAYIASLDVQHKIHCLNELRKMAFADYGDDQPTKKVHGQLWWIHLRHCVDMLAQDLICHADADLITYQWADTEPNPFPDFSLNRQCRSLDDLIAYRDEHRVDMDQYVAMPKPTSGIKQVPMDPEFYAMYGFKNSDLFPNGRDFGPLPKADWFGVPPSVGVPPDDREHGH